MRRSKPRLVVVDCETTGFASHDRIVEIAAISLDPRTLEPIDEFDTLVNPERDVGPVGVHGITASMVEAAPIFAEIAQRFRAGSLARSLSPTICHSIHGCSPANSPDSMCLSMSGLAYALSELQGAGSMLHASDSASLSTIIIEPLPMPGQPPF